MPSLPSSMITESPMRDSQTRHATTQPHVSQQASRRLIDSWIHKEAFPRAYLGDGERAGAAYPATDKWHTAEEVDVRAEPLTPVNLGYPEHLAARIRGRVRIALFIDELGWVRKAQVLASEPERFFDLVAIQAWQDVRFSPALKGDLPVKSEKLLEIDFVPY
jgi:TonB family protein